MNKEMTFDSLVDQVKNVHEATSAMAQGAVNQILTARNWVIGCYIVEYEQNGKERAKYGTKLLKNLAKSLQIKGLENNQLNLCRMFYLRYPQIFSTVSRKLDGLGFDDHFTTNPLSMVNADDDNSLRKFSTKDSVLKQGKSELLLTMNTILLIWFYTIAFFIVILL